MAEFSLLTTVSGSRLYFELVRAEFTHLIVISEEAKHDISLTF